MIVTNTDRIRAELESRIVSGELAPGSTLDESRLGKLFDVSRTPVREALLQLSAEGFVRIVPRAGIYVVELEAAEVADLFETLAHGEGSCAALAAERLSDGALDRLAELHDTGRQYMVQRQFPGYHDYCMAFHQAVYAGAANRCLTRHLTYLRKRLNPYQQKFADKLADGLAQSWESRDALMRALLQRNAADARRYATQDVLDQADFFLDIARDAPDYLYFSSPPPGIGNRARAELSRLFTPVAIWSEAS